MKTNEIKTIDIHAKEWFDKINGNSYFSAKVILNYQLSNEEVFIIPFQYGYGEQYVYETMRQLIKKGFIVADDVTPLWRYCEENKIVLRYDKEKNCKKRELWGSLKAHKAVY